MVWYQVILLMLLTACGTYPPEREVNSKEYRIESPEFEYYIDRFEELSLTRRPLHITSLIMRFSELEGSVIGLCQFRRNSSPIITISEVFWEGASDAARENLIFHELGHCILERDHLERKDQGVPVSLMFPSIIPWYYERDKKPYINELYSIFGDWFNLTDTDAEDKTWSCPYEVH